MRIDEFISELRDKNIIVTVHNEQLAITDPDDNLIPEIIGRLKSNKSEIIQFFQSITKQKSFETIEKAPEADHYPLSSTQLRMYFLQQLDKSSIAYNMPMAFQIQGSPDFEALNRAFHELIYRHESLRTLYKEENGTPAQFITDGEGFAIEYLKSGKDQVESVLKSFVRPFNLNSDYPIRVGVCTVSDTEQYLFLDVHHIAGDLGSTAIIIKDLISLYQGINLSELPLQYKDYAFWQQTEAQQEKLAAHKEFWLTQFSDEFSPIELPAIAERPLVKNNKGAAYSFSLGKKATEGLQAIANEKEATLFMVLFSIYNILLGKLANTKDITVGTPVSGRAHPDLEPIVGMFVNTLPIRSILDTKLSYNEFLDTSKSHILECLEHQNYEYESLVETLKITRNPARNPLFDVLFVFQKTEEAQSNVLDSVLKPFSKEVTTSKFDLTLFCREEGNNIYCDFEYYTEIFDEATVKSFANYFTFIVDQIVTSPQTKISDLALLDGTAQQEVLLNFNNTNKDYPNQETIHNLFESQVLKTPELKAITFQGASLTYQQLNERANQLASYLRKNGAAPNKVIGVYQQRSFEMVISILAILKSGAAYLPIDPDYPLHRVEKMVSDSNMILLLTDNTPANSIHEIIDWVNVKTQDFRNQPVQNLENLNNYKDLIYVIYTSGSTGTPKGVMVNHRNLVNLMDYTLTETNIDASSVLQFTTLTFDPSFVEIFSALLSGGVIHLIDEVVSRDFSKLLAHIEANGITSIYMPSSVLNQMFNAPEYIDQLPTTLKNIITAGEQVVVGNQFKKYLSENKIYLHNYYGPAETHVVTACAISPYKTIPTLPTIGVPIQNTQIYIFDEGLNEQPVNVPGELYIGGDQVGNGYLLNPTLTAEKFIENPLQPGDILYKTGDLAKWDISGNIVFLGRIDQQVKLNGVRIEPGEIQSHINKLEGIVESAVVIKEVRNKKVLVAYYVADKEISTNTFRTYLTNHLPISMIPNYYMRLAEMPLTATGKVNRRAFPTPEVKREEDYVAPSTDIEKKLANIWFRVLDVEEELISIHADFFAMGGHSLSAITLSNRINRELSVEVAIKDLFVRRTIKGLANFIETSAQTTFKNIPEAPQLAHYPLSSAQRRMYFLYEFDKQSTTYNMPVFLRIGRNLDITQLNSAFQALVERHKTLRTLFALVENVPMQHIVPAEQFSVNQSKIKKEDLENTINSFVKPFNLSEELPVRVSLVEVVDEDYLLMIDMHHIINDGVSQQLLIKEFWDHYHNKTLPELRLQYTDYAYWQQGETHQELVQKHKSYWLQQFADEITAIDLPTDHSRPSKRSGKGGMYSFTLDDATGKKLKTIAKEAGTTNFTLFLALYNLFLSKLSNQEDIIIGTPTVGRHHADLENLVGMFVNTLVLRNQVDANIDFQQFLAAVQESTLTAFDHQLFQYEELVDSLALPRNTSRNPLFDVFFTYGLDEKSTQISSNNLTIKEHEVPYDISKFDLTLDVSDGEETTITFNYSLDLFKESTIKKFSKYFKAVINAVAENRNAKIGEIDLVSDADKQILEAYNNTGKSFNLDITVLEMFEKQVLAAPTSTAVVIGNENVTYEELNNRVNLWARYLISNGIKPGMVAGLIMTRSVEMITAILAVMKAGGAYLPINPGQPKSRTDFMLEECEVKMLISNVQDHALESFENYTVLSPEQLDNSTSDKTIDLHGFNTNSLAYIIYTSGSTGTPKGVMVNHKSLTNFVYYGHDIFNINIEDKILQFSPYYFDVSVEQIWLAFTSGASLVLLDEETLLDTSKFTAYVDEQRITHLNLTPSFLELLELPKLEHLKRIVVSGEACKPSLALKYCNDYDFYNEYGPTECTIISISCKITLRNIGADSIPIGYPITNSKSYILGKNKELLPIGVAGELYIGGENLAEGYINRPDLTKERFIANPFGEGRLYKTGDVARWNPDGTIAYLGRNDHQVKLRGYRIELGEIEAQLEQMTAVNQALVLAIGEATNKKLVAYITGETKVNTQEVNEYLQSNLPDYMVPSSYIWLEAFPLTPNGKIDRRALPAPEITLDAAYLAPQTYEEKLLVGIWAEVLKVEENKIGIHNDFFVLGGHSLLAITLLNRINKALKVALTLRDLFANRTIAKLVDRIAALENSNFYEIVKAPEADHYPLSSTQLRMYFLQQLDKSSIAYNMPMAFQIQGSPDFEALNRAFHELIYRHESLRTLYKEENGTPAQFITDGEGFAIEYLKSGKDQVESVLKSFVRPFNLNSDYPIRVGVCTVSDTEQYLFLDVHHIAGDLGSTAIIIKDLISLYQGINLSELPLQYKDYAFWQQTEAQQEKLAAHKEFWLTQFSDEFSPIELPAIAERPLVKNNKGAAYSFSLGKKATEGLQAIANEKEATLFMVLFSIYNILLGKLANTKDITVGTPVSGRAHPDLEPIVGMFVNTLPIRSILDTKLSYNEFLDTSKSHILECLEHQNYEYESLVETLKITRNPARNPLFDVLFVFQKTEEAQSNVLDSVLKPFSKEVTTSKFDLTLFCREEGNNIYCDFEYYTEIFDEATVKSFANYFTFIVDQIVTSPQTKISDLALLDGTAQQEVLLNFNNTNKDYPNQETIHNLFESQVLKTPELKAITFQGASLTYQQLNERANQLASYLRKNGAAPNKVIGVYQQRSFEMVISILAILKSGAAYLPIDPDYPLHRVEKMVSDSNMILLLTDNTPANSIHEIIDWVNVKTQDFRNQPVQNLENLNNYKDLIYVIYTSGSTGTPKGVMVNHRNLVNLMDYTLTETNIDASSVLQFTTLTFDPSFVEIFSALLSGGVIHLIDEVVSRDFSKLLAHIEANGITSIYMPSSVLNQMFNAPEYIDQLPTTLKNIITAGEQVVVGNQFKKYLSENKIYLHNYYGPAETHVVTACAISPYKTIPTLPTIGVPIQNTQIYIFDEGLNEQPVNVPGELYIGGDQVGNGYLLNPTLTAEKFIENPLQPGDILYKTGDLAKWDISGNIVFLGRIDQQVKLNGVRIEPGEIQSHINKLEGIVESAVVIKEVRNKKVLVAYYVADKEISTNTFRTYLTNHLPISMIPNYYMRLAEMPLTATGKVNRRAFPIPEIKKEEDYVAPSTATEKKLVEIWAEVLDIKENEIGMYSDFFVLGGHSLLAIKLINKINVALSVTITLRNLFANRTIAELDKFIATTGHTETVTIPKAVKATYYPLSAAQNRMYFLYEFDKTSTAYNMPVILRLNSAIDKAQLETALTALSNRHESLRSLFELVDGVAMQRVLNENSFKLIHQQIKAAEVKETVTNFVRPFDLAKEPGLRVAFFEVAEETPLLMIDTHHIINDGVSQEILVREFGSLFAGEVLPELSLQYKDYAVWQQGEIYQSMVNQHKEYWIDAYNEELDWLQLPTDFNRPLSPGNAGALHEIKLTKTTSDQLREIALQEGVTTYTLFLGLYYVLLYKLSNQHDIVVGTPTSGRGFASLEGIVGMFVNTLALRNQLNPKSSFRSFLVQLQQNTLNAFDHQFYPYEELVDALGVSRDTGRNPLFDVFFSYTNNSEESNENHLFSGYNTPYEIAKFDLSLDIEDSEQITLSFNYRTDLFEAHTIERFTTYLEKIVACIVTNIDQEISNISILPETEKLQLLQDFNASSIDIDITKTVLNQFLEVANQNPNAQAVKLGEECITYGELNEHSTKWAHKLVDSGLEPGSIVGLITNRSIEMIVGMLAILKSGGAYLPLNPDQPLSRTEFILQECACKFIITNVAEMVGSLSENYQLFSHVDLDRYKYSKEKSLPKSDAESLAYIIYTSGSTGLPKGVPITNGALTNLMSFQVNHLEITPSDNVLQISPYIFDASVQQIWTALIAGATLVLIDQETILDIEAFEKYLIKNEISFIDGTPSLIENISIANVPSLRLIISGGEECKPSLAKRLAERARFINEYGPTECTITTTQFEVLPETQIGTSLSIGKPIANKQIYILDEYMNLVPVGVRGEMYIGGAGISKGYINREDLNKERFLPNPFGEGTVYKTGDVARWNKDGNLIFLGRNDHQVKLRGYRIELGEIEAQIEQLETVTQALVVARGEENRKKLVAYITGKKEIAVHQIIEFLQDSLPDYMVPSAFVWLDEFPLNASDKIDRLALPEPELATTQVYVAPTTKQEKMLVAIWAEVLQLEAHEIGVNSDFFALGGHSLLAMKMRHLLKQSFEQSLSLSEIFLKPTIQAMAKQLERYETQKQEDTTIVKLNNSNSEHKLFIIHDGSGKTNSYLELTRQLTNYACYGLRFRTSGEAKKAPEITAMASNYIDEIKAIQETGPYTLMGWSLGGEVAAEMTYQLEKAGEQVENLIVIDSSFKFMPTTEAINLDIESEFNLLRSQFGYTSKSFSNSASLEDIWNEFAASEVFETATLETLRKSVPNHIRELIPDFAELNKKQLFETVNRIRLVLAASSKYYINNAINANTLYIWPTESREIPQNQEFEKYFTNFNMQHTSGDHFSVMKQPNVSQLSKIIIEQLELKLVEEIPN